LIETAAKGFSQDGGTLISAALAFHTLLSLAPLVIITVAVSSTVLGEGAAQAEIARFMQESMGPKVSTTIMSWVETASRSSEAASLLGLGLVLLAASRMGENLREAMNRIFNVEQKTAEGFRGTVEGLVRRRLFAFGLALAAGPMLIAIFASRALLTRFHDLLFPDSAWAAGALQAGQLALSLGVVALGSALVLRVVPDEGVPFRRAFGGGVVISLLFNAGNALIGLYLGRAGVGAAYGIASSAVVVLLWLQFSSTIFLFSCELVQAHARLQARWADEDDGVEHGTREADSDPAHTPAAESAR
jgi:membrane protein